GAHELLEREATLATQLEQLRDEHPRYGVALDDALHPATQLHDREQVEGHAGRGADDAELAAPGEAVDQSGEDRCDPGGVEGVRGTAAGQVEDLRDLVVVLAVDRVGGAELPGQLQALLDDVDRDDRA